MNVEDFGRCASGIFASALMLAGCGSLPSQNFAGINKRRKERRPQRRGVPITLQLSGTTRWRSAAGGPDLLPRQAVRNNQLGRRHRIGLRRMRNGISHRHGWPRERAVPVRGGARRRISRIGPGPRTKARLLPRHHLFRRQRLLGKLRNDFQDYAERARARPVFVQRRHGWCSPQGRGVRPQCQPLLRHDVGGWTLRRWYGVRGEKFKRRGRAAQFRRKCR